MSDRDWIVGGKKIMTDVERILIDRYGWSAIEAENELFYMCERVLEGENPEKILEEYDIESDYILDIV